MDVYCLGQHQVWKSAWLVCTVKLHHPGFSTYALPYSYIKINQSIDVFKIQISLFLENLSVIYIRNNCCIKCIQGNRKNGKY